MKNLLSILFLFCSIAAFGKIKQTVHQTFTLEDATQTLYLDLVGDYEIEPWPSNSIMSETKIELYDASPHVLNYFMEKEERYKINQSDPGSTITLSAHDKARKEIKYKDADCFELVKLKIYVPDSFEIVDNRTLKKKTTD